MSALPITLETRFIYTSIVNAKTPLDPAMDDIRSRDLDHIWEELKRRPWAKEHRIYVPGMPREKKEFWANFIKNHVGSPLPVVTEFLEKNSSGDGKLAIDLGCGNSPVIRPLLERGWRIIAVDNSEVALQKLRERNRSEVASGQLSLVCEDIEKFTSTEQADLLIAADSLPYTDPTQFRATWEKIHKMLKEGGIFMGTLFRSAPTEKQTLVMNLIRNMGAWDLPDRRMVRALLEKNGYQVQTCRYRKDVPESDEQLVIQFRAIKKEPEENDSAAAAATVD